MKALKKIEIKKKRQLRFLFPPTKFKYPTNHTDTQGGRIEGDQSVG